MAGAGKDNIHMIKQQVPKFIREFKEKTNQPEPPNIDSKRFSSKDIDDADDDNTQKPDEAPVICVANDVSNEEAYNFTKKVYGEEAINKTDLNTKRKHDQADDNVEDGKVVFKKPSREKGEKKGPKKVESKMPKIKNPTLLSFGDDEEEEDT